MSLPAGVRNNNPGNLGYVPGGYLVQGPSVNFDVGTGSSSGTKFHQAVYANAQDGMAAAAHLALQKFNGGKITVNALIASDPGGWTPRNFQAAANIARTMGVSPSQPLNLRDATQMQSFLRGLVLQEQGPEGFASYDPGVFTSAASGVTGNMATAAPGLGNSGILGQRDTKSGEGVSQWQRQLAAAGFDPGPIDGKFGAQTAQATRAFQAKAGIPTDGRVGPQTLAAANQPAVIADDAPEGLRGFVDSAYGLTPAEDATQAMASGAPIPQAPANMATTPPPSAEEAYSSHAATPVMPAMKPITAGPYGSDSILRAELANSPAAVAKANADIRANVINKETVAGALWNSGKIAKSITDYLKTGVTSDPVLGQAIKANIISNPGLLVDATPAVRADTMKTLNAVPAVTPTGNIPLPSARPIYDGGPSMATTPPPTDFSAGLTADTTPARSPDTAAPVSSQGEVPASVTWPSMASASGKDALQAVSDKTPAPSPVASMATSPPPDFTPAAPAQMVGGITVPPVIGSPADVPDVSVGAAPPVTVAPAAPPKTIAAAPPPSKAAGGRAYRAIAQPISEGSPNFWSGPMRQPNFTAGSGGATMAYQPNTGRTTTDVRGDKVNVGVYTDQNGTQHQYTWSPSGAP